MKIAVTYDNGQVYQHFGHCQQFQIFELDGKEIKGSEIIDANGAGHGALVGFLMENDIKILICGGIGPGAKNGLAACGIEVFPGVVGDTEAAVMAWTHGILDFDPDTECDCHGHGHNHGDGECHCHDHEEEHECHCHDHE